MKWRCVIKWFKHDTDASIDAKLQEVLLDYGAAGYGLYWYCVELIAKDVTPRNITFELEHDTRIIARNLNLSIQEVKDMMQKMINLGLFDITINNKISCIKLSNRLDDFTRKGTQTIEILDNYKLIQNHSVQSPDLVRTKSDKVRLDKNRLEENRLEKNKDNSQQVDPKSTSRLTPYSEIIKIFHEELPSLQSVKEITDKRKRAIKKLWDKDLPDLENWRNYFKHVSKSKFLMGQTTGMNGRSFKCTIDFLINYDKFINIYENKYHG